MLTSIMPKKIVLSMERIEWFLNFKIPYWFCWSKKVLKGSKIVILHLDKLQNLLWSVISIIQVCNHGRSTFWHVQLYDSFWGPKSYGFTYSKIPNLYPRPIPGRSKNGWRRTPNELHPLVVSLSVISFHKNLKKIEKNQRISFSK